MQIMLRLFGDARPRRVRSSGKLRRVITAEAKQAHWYPHIPQDRWTSKHWAFAAWKAQQEQKERLKFEQRLRLLEERVPSMRRTVIAQSTPQGDESNLPAVQDALPKRSPNAPVVQGAHEIELEKQASPEDPATGDPRAQLALGLMLAKRGDTEGSLYWLRWASYSGYMVGDPFEA